MENLLAALAVVLEPYNIGMLFFGTLIGILVGAMPGLSSVKIGRASCRERVSINV